MKLNFVTLWVIPQELKGGELCGIALGLWEITQEHNPCGQSEKEINVT